MVMCSTPNPYANDKMLWSPPDQKPRFSNTERVSHIFKNKSLMTYYELL